MPTVYFDSPANSTFFTTCCQVAITDSQANCPSCKKEITPRSHEGRWNTAFRPYRRKTPESGSKDAKE
jgi:hypothetical protein